MAEAVESSEEEEERVHALGVSHNHFDPTRPGNLCRGRERWIEPYELEGEPDEIHRYIVTGGAMIDDAAADCYRGLPHSNVEMAAVIAAIFPDRQLLAWEEDGHPADIPDDAHGVEMFTGYRAGGLSEEMRVRWYKTVSGYDEIRAILGPDPHHKKVRGFAVLEGDEDLDEVFDVLYELSGMSTLDSPPACYNPAALPAVLEVVPAVVVIHRDKHGPAVGVYSAEQLHDELDELHDKLHPICDEAGTLLVPFAIPPMLARWDRALAELKTEWMDERPDEEFPVPPSPEPTRWMARYHRRQQKKRDAKKRKKMKDAGEE